MAKTPTVTKATRQINAQPRFHQRAREIQAYGTVSHLLPLELEEPVRLEMTEQLNQLLADTMSLRDLYKKCHWQVAGPTFYQLHLLYAMIARMTSLSAMCCAGTSFKSGS